MTPRHAIPLLPTQAAICPRLPPRAGLRTTTHPPMTPRGASGLGSDSEQVLHRLGFMDHHNPVITLIFYKDIHWNFNAQSEYVLLNFLLKFLKCEKIVVHMIVTRLF